MLTSNLARYRLVHLANSLRFALDSLAASLGLRSVFFVTAAILLVIAPTYRLAYAESIDRSRRPRGTELLSVTSPEWTAWQIRPTT